MKRNFFANINIVNSSTLPIIINTIKTSFEKLSIFLKSKFSKPYIFELTVFIIVRIPSLNDSTISLFAIVNKKQISNNEIINIITERKYLLISDWSIFFSLKVILLIKIYLGLEWDKSSLKEYFIRENIFKNLIPEEVEKNEPPIITNIKNIKYNSDWSLSIEMPILDILLVIEKNSGTKLFSLLKNIKNNNNKNIKYISK